MKTVFVGICSILFIGILFFLFNRNLKHARKKTSIYLHSSELEPTPSSLVMEPDEVPDQETDAEWGKFQ